MHYRNEPRVFLNICLLVALTTLIISSCQLPGVSEITGITPTPMTPSPTPRICPNINFDPSSGLKVTRTLIVVLFDNNSTENQQVLEYLDGQKTGDVIGFIDKVLPKALGIGDEYSIFQLGYRTYEGARYDRYSAQISDAPDIFPTPQPHQTLTPVATPLLGDGTPGLVILQQKNRYGTAIAQQYATSTQLAFEDLCKGSAYATAYQSTNVAWTITNQAASTEIATNVVEDIESTPVVIETPFAGDALYEGLSHATIDFESQCAEYDRCVLMIIDDLIDWRNTGPVNEIPDYLQFNLKGIEVIVVVPTCRDLQQPSCTRLKDLWTDEFILFKAKDPIIYLNGDRLEEHLLQLIGDN